MKKIFLIERAKGEVAGTEPQAHPFLKQSQKDGRSGVQCGAQQSKLGSPWSPISFWRWRGQQGQGGLSQALAPPGSRSPGTPLTTLW